MGDFENLGKIIEKVMSDDESKKKILQLAENLNLGSEEDSEPIDITPVENDGISNIQSIYKSITGGNDKRVRLLNALKPYISQKHSFGVDNAITVIQLATISSNLGINKIFEKRGDE